ncbi:MAG: hypothetical protein MUF64_22805 [Polyangiaceae bacterium]|nr:hypothetical protein [Polyangiaceae bacterium]
MPPETDPAPSTSGSALCPRHGLRFDPRLSSGCVRCRRTRDDPPPRYAGRIGLLLAALGLVALAFPARSALRAYFAPASSAIAIPPDAPPEHRRCLAAEGTSQALAAVATDCQQACERGWGPSCRRLAGLCSPAASLLSGDPCGAGPLALLQQACQQRDPIACTLTSEWTKIDVLWKACDSGLGGPCAELAPFCDPQRALLTDGAPSTAWAFLAHPSLRAACASGPARLYERGCMLGNWLACEHPDARSRVSPEKLRELLEHACDQADAGACRRLAALVHPEDPALSSALNAYARDLDACASGDCSQVRRWRDRLGEERPKAAAQGASSSEDACRQQNIVASCWTAAEAFATGEGVKQDLARSSALHAHARKLLQDGCKQPGGDCASPDTLRALEACDRGEGASCLSVVQAQGGALSAAGPTAPLFHRGARLLGIDCEQRKGAACWTLASLHSKGALPGGENGAVDLLRKGCDARHGLSCNDLGRRSEQGRGLPQDRNSAERMFRRASELLVADCEGGQREACGALAEILGAGKGVPRDEARAEQYRSKAAPAPSR